MLLSKFADSLGLESLGNEKKILSIFLSPWLGGYSVLSEPKMIFIVLDSGKNSFIICLNELVLNPNMGQLILLDLRSQGYNNNKWHRHFFKLSFGLAHLVFLCREWLRYHLADLPLISAGSCDPLVWFLQLRAATWLGAGKGQTKVKYKESIFKNYFNVTVQTPLYVKMHHRIHN